ncbi:MAG: AroM family protein [Fusobacteriaceae bacterium]|jgi:protein AroM|nr:AroM family protein [Fusobacteriaceae bacterium]
MKKKIGTVTIGQAPRTDVMADIIPILGNDVEIVEAGALDGLSKEEIAAFAPVKGDYVLVTRLTDGSSVQVAEKYITPRIIEKIQKHFENDIPLVLLLCTGEFPEFSEKGLLIRPQRILFHAVDALARGKKLGVLTPSPDQVAQSAKRWGELSKEVKVLASSPYVDGMKNAEAAAKELAAWGADLVILDCIGYTSAMQQTVRDIVGSPAILGRGIAARTVKELLG